LYFKFFQRFYHKNVRKDIQPETILSGILLVCYDNFIIFLLFNQVKLRFIGHFYTNFHTCTVADMSDKLKTSMYVPALF